MTNQTEIWKPVAETLYWGGLGKVYEVSNLGRVRNKNTGHILKSTPYSDNPKRLRVTFHNGPYSTLSFLRSHVVWETFVGPCYNKRIGFKDGNHENCELSNLYMKSKK